MKLRRIIIYCIIVAITFSMGCKDAGEITQIDGLNLHENDPSVANIQNSLSISVTAKAFNSALEYSIRFDKTTFNLALSIDNLTTGDVSIQIYNDTKQMLYKGDFTQKISLAQIITLDETPTKIKFVFNNLSANFSCAFSVK